MMRDAMIAVEDRRFRSHLGVDPIGIVRGALARASPSGSWRQGGSTITQQLARNIFLTNDRTFARKIREGDIGAGARMALLQGPDPRTLSEPRLFRRRRLWHRRRLAPLLRPQRDDALDRRGGDHRRPRQGAVQLFADRRRRGGARPRRRRARPDGRAAARSPRPRPPTRRSRATSSSSATPSGRTATRYFTDWVLPQLDTLIDETVQPLDVWTTIDPNMQRAADARRSTPMRRAARRALWSRSTATARSGRWSAAATMSNSSYNRATQAIRQPGSSFKLFVYMTAIESGYRPDSIVQDEPITIDGWSPRNDNGRHVGPVADARRLRLFDQHRRGAARPGGRHPRGRRHGAALRHHHPCRHQPVDGARHLRRSG